MICSFCDTSILASHEPWGYHHTDPRLFRSSVKQGCMFCAGLADEIGGSEFIDDLFRSRPSGQAICRWSLRKVAKIRESKEQVVITFRSLPEVPCSFDIEFLMFSRLDLGSLPTMSMLGASTHSEQTRNQIKTWIRHCKAHHPKCAPQHRDHRLMPTRLLDLGTGDFRWPLKLVRLVETRPGFQEPYMTLSHCWGTKHFLNLEESNLQEFLTVGLPWETLIQNKTFKEAIEVVRSLDIRYLWIDSLCIIQRQPGKEDWLKEGELMHRYYRNSFGTIAASSSNDSEGGLFRNRNSSLDRIVASKYTTESSSAILGNKAWYIVPTSMWSKQVLGQPLYTRGWVFQERTLSSRIIHFASEQVFWECSTINACETFPEGLPDSVDHAAVTDRHWRTRLQDVAPYMEPMTATAFDSMHQFWKNAVAIYTKCKLTDQSDKLRALWGVAKLVRDASGEEFGEGLWAGSLHEQLAWRTIGKSLPSQREPIVIDGNEVSSWTWASTREPVALAERFPSRPRFYVATSHDGAGISFSLEKPLFQQSKEDFNTWNEVIQDMGDRLQNSKQFRSAASKVKPITMATNSRADFLPKLMRHQLAIQGLVGMASLVFIQSADRWELVFNDLDSNTVSFPAFPDYQPTAKWCHFVLLAVSYEDDFGDEWQENLPRRYSGTGLLLEHLGMTHFRRVGVFMFTGIANEEWNGLRQACGQTLDDLMSVPEPCQGLKLWLR